MNFLAAVLIGAVVGGIGGFVTDPGYGWKEATLQVVLAIAGLVVVYLLANRAAASDGTASSGS